MSLVVENWSHCPECISYSMFCYSPLVTNSAFVYVTVTAQVWRWVCVLQWSIPSPLNPQILSPAPKGSSSLRHLCPGSSFVLNTHCMSHVHVCITTVCLPCLVLCINYKGPESLLVPISPVRRFFLSMELCHVFYVTSSLFFCGKLRRWGSRG